MVRLKEEGEHFKPPQSTRGHFQPMSEHLCQSRGILSMAESRKLLWFSRTQHPLLLPYESMTNLISLKMPGLTLLLVTHQMQLNLSLSLLHLLLPPSRQFHRQLLQCHQELFHKTLVCLHFTSPPMTKQ